MKNLLFLCTGNSCRSQMAEAFGRHYKSDLFNFSSAGTKKQTLNPYAVKVMDELGIDMSEHFSKTVEELPDSKMDFVITVCSHAQETCPNFPGKGKRIHRGFDDPPSLTEDFEDEKEKLKVFRRVRDEIKQYVLTLPEALESQ